MYVCLNRATAGGPVSFDQFVQLAADAGFPGCDVDMGWGQQHGAAALQDLFASRKLKFGGWGPNVDWRKPDSNPQKDIPTLKAQAKVARQIGADSCSTWIMPSSALPFRQNWDFHVKGLRLIAKVLADNGLRLGLEFVAPYHLRRQFPHEFIFTPGQMLELAADVGDNVGLLVDCFHCHAAGTTWEHLAQIPKEKIVLVHLNDCPDVPQGKIQDFQRLLPGEGVIDLPAFVAALKQAGYSGPVALEVFNDDLKKMPPADAAKKAYAATKSALGGTGVI